MATNKEYNTGHLSDQELRVTQESGTEPPFSGDLLKEKRDGLYHCVVCDQRLFSSDTKYDSGTGWPSSTKMFNSDNIRLAADTSLGRERTEVLCANCDAHLGHVFTDGPEKSADVPTTGKRFCINSCALEFEPDTE